jgi:hypothetical protein
VVPYVHLVGKCDVGSLERHNELNSTWKDTQPGSEGQTYFNKKLQNN